MASNNIASTAIRTLQSTTSSKQSISPFLPRDFIGNFPTSFIGPRKQPTTSFDTLVNSLTHSLTTTPSPHLPTLTKLLRNYTSNPSEWQKYAYANPSKQYTRNLVAEVEVHDHAASHCLMKIMKGGLKETRWITPTVPPSASLAGNKEIEMQIEGVREYGMEKVAYMCDDMGLHSIANPSNTEYAVSLHLYTPPNAAMHGCHIFDPLTGEKTHVKPGAYDSVRGVITSDI
ncbi:hypothetical protein EYC84_008745 [Monilinia fructicola]|uniref:Cysteine dioxygenase n=1 Tax=Monilinia fructicola TaxID=38448 RepID=A0A5M9JE91_MONFR|nr:hypothetical protein EYC84_008745 [Monilinia fructicola]